MVMIYFSIQEGKEISIDSEMTRRTCLEKRWTKGGWKDKKGRNYANPQPK